MNLLHCIQKRIPRYIYVFVDRARSMPRRTGSPEGSAVYLHQMNKIYGNALKHRQICVPKMWSSLTVQNKKLHEKRCPKYQQTVKELRSLLNKISGTARNALETHVSTKFDISRFYEIDINDDEETDVSWVKGNQEVNEEL